MKSTVFTAMFFCIFFVSANASAELVQIDMDDPGDGVSRAVCSKNGNLYLMDGGLLWQYTIDGSGGIELASIPQYSEEGGVDVVCGEKFLYTLSGKRINVYKYFASPYGVENDQLLLRSSLYAQHDAQKLWSNDKWLVTAGGPEGVVVYAVDETGVLIEKDSALEGNYAKQFKVWGNNDFVYVSCGDTIYVYSIDEEGRLNLLDTVAQSNNVLSISGDGDFLYVSNLEGIHVYGKDGLTGILTYLSSTTEPSMITWSDGVLVYSSDSSNYKVNIYEKNVSSRTLTLIEQIEFGWEDFVSAIAGSDDGYIFLGRYISGASSHYQTYEKKEEKNSASLTLWVATNIATLKKQVE